MNMLILPALPVGFAVAEPFPLALEVPAFAAAEAFALEDPCCWCCLAISGIAAGGLADAGAEG